MNLLLDQNAGIAHQTRLAIVSVAESIPDNVMESEILRGVIAGLERLYNPEADHDGNDNDIFASHRDEQDGEAELGKMLVVVVRIFFCYICYLAVQDGILLRQSNIGFIAFVFFSSICSSLQH